MASASVAILIALALLMGLAFLVALVAVVVMSSSRRGTWTPGVRDQVRDSPDL